VAASYLLRVVTDFAAAHALRDYPGACRRLHGHNWKVETEVFARTLDDSGMAIDFKTIKQAAKRVTDELDHQFLNELSPFDRINPTAENMAAYLYRRLGEELNDTRVRVHAVTLWETERASVRYTEEEHA